jgi:flagellar hook-associated protein 3 FlgL
VSSGEIISGDVNGIQPTGVFSTLIRLRAALRSSDTAEIGVAAAELETLTEQVNENRGIVGTTSASLSRRVEGIEDEVLAARSRLSEIEDLDYAAAITEFTQLQTALEASMLTGSRLLSLSFLDFLR